MDFAFDNPFEDVFSDPNALKPNQTPVVAQPVQPIYQPPPNNTPQFHQPTTFQPPVHQPPPLGQTLGQTNTAGHPPFHQPVTTPGGPPSFQPSNPPGYTPTPIQNPALTANGVHPGGLVLPAVAKAPPTFNTQIPPITAPANANLNQHQLPSHQSPTFTPPGSAYNATPANNPAIVSTPNPVFNQPTETPQVAPVTQQPVVEQPQQAQPTAPAPAAEVNLNEVWREAKAPNGRVYYYKKSTRETTWIKPNTYIPLGSSTPITTGGGGAAPASTAPSQPTNPTPLTGFALPTTNQPAPVTNPTPTVQENSNPALAGSSTPHLAGASNPALVGYQAHPGLSTSPASLDHSNSNPALAVPAQQHDSQYGLGNDNNSGYSGYNNNAASTDVNTSHQYQYETTDNNAPQHQVSQQQPQQQQPPQQQPQQQPQQHSEPDPAVVQAAAAAAGLYYDPASGQYYNPNTASVMLYDVPTGQFYDPNAQLPPSQQQQAQQNDPYGGGMYQANNFGANPALGYSANSPGANPMLPPVNQLNSSGSGMFGALPQANSASNLSSSSGSVGTPGTPNYPKTFKIRLPQDQRQVVPFKADQTLRSILVKICVSRSLTMEDYLAKDRSGLDIPLDKTLGEINQEEISFLTLRPGIVPQDETKRKSHKIMSDIYEANAGLSSSLQSVLKNYRDPMLKIAQDIDMRKRLLTEQECNQIFNGLESISSLLRDFNSQLSTQLSTWPVELGDMVQRHMEIIPFYSDFVNNYKSNMNKLEELRRNPDFNTYLDGVQKTLNTKFRLEDFFSLPALKIATISSLVDSLIGVLTDQHPNYFLLREFHQKLFPLANQAVTLRQQMESRSKIVAMETNIQKFPKKPTFVHDQRIWFREGTIEMTIKKKPALYYVVLFTDLMIICKAPEKKKKDKAATLPVYEEFIPFNSTGCTVEELGSQNWNLHIDQGGKGKVTFLCSYSPQSEHTKSEWVNSFKDAFADFSGKPHLKPPVF